jgi:hypothetical protein
MLLAILFAYFGYKKAKDSGRNGFLWAFIALAAFIGSQFLVGILIGLGMGIGIAFLGWSESVFESYDILVRILAIIAGILGGYLVLKYLDRIPQDDNYTAPPPPPDFRG